MEANQRELEIQLHNRLLNDDVTASAEIAEQFLFLVIQQLRRRYAYLDDPHLVDTAVHDAFMHYFQHPEQYNPTKSSLMTYLRMSAEGDLRNMLRGRASIPVIAEGDLVYNVQESRMIVPDRTVDIEWNVQNKLSPVWSHLRDQLPNPVDREIVQMMLNQERRTVVYAGILGLQCQPPDEQQRIVKRHKDRLRKKLRRVLDPAVFRNNDTR